MAFPYRDRSAGGNKKKKKQFGEYDINCPKHSRHAKYARAPPFDPDYPPVGRDYLHSDPDYLSPRRTPRHPPASVRLTPPQDDPLEPPPSPPTDQAAVSEDEKKTPRPASTFNGVKDSRFTYVGMPFPCPPGGWTGNEETDFKASALHWHELWRRAPDELEAVGPDALIHQLWLEREYHRLRHWRVFGKGAQVNLSERRFEVDDGFENDRTNADSSSTAIDAEVGQLAEMQLDPGSQLGDPDPFTSVDSKEDSTKGGSRKPKPKQDQQKTPKQPKDKDRQPAKHFIDALDPEERKTLGL